MFTINKNHTHRTHNIKKNKYNVKPCLHIKYSKKKLLIYYEIIALTKRLYTQIYRRPSTLIAGIIQPLLWLILFSALFQNAPVLIFTKNIKYGEFLSPGIIMFTAFTGSMNAGLPIIFDREFGFLNRLLISPLKNRNSLIISCLINICTITICQIIAILCISILLFYTKPVINYINGLFYISILIIVSTANLSICLAFLLPGHIEFLAFLLIINLPTLFSSTALAPLSFMPYWLQIVACINPLTYAIEILRHIYLNLPLDNTKYIIETIWINLNLYQSMTILLTINIINFTIVNYIIKYK
uniref:ABC transmembrane type-2 domain-containing protein n=1 Tax=Spermothamnion repens TaxID=31383 RepID=A0A4D6X0A8_9FLOR|nr:hypothetical protein [Spermothamnion repens]